MDLACWGEGCWAPWTLRGLLLDFLKLGDFISQRNGVRGWAISPTKNKTKDK